MEILHPQSDVTILVIGRDDNENFALRPLIEMGILVIHNIQVKITRTDDNKSVLTSPVANKKINTSSTIAALRIFCEECAKQFRQTHRLAHLPVVSNRTKARYHTLSTYFAYRHELEAEQVTVGKMELALLRDLRTVIPHLSVRAYGYGAEGERQYNKYLKILRQLNDLDIKEMQNGTQRAS